MKLLKKWLTEKGPFSFYKSTENRKECCRIRKVVPLKRALEGMECWISGIRAGQSENRNQMDWLEFDESKNLFKFYPLFNWSFDEVKNYIDENNIPYNSLHDKGYVSIGCEPCTRAVKPGQISGPAGGGGKMMNQRSAGVMSDERLNSTEAQWPKAKNIATSIRIPNTEHRTPKTEYRIPNTVYLS